MSSSWPLIRLGDVLAVQRRWLRPEPDHKYVEIGVRSYGRGIFHKPPVSGLSLGDKRVLRIEPGDLVFMNVFAWEGAVAVASTRDTNTIGSHRFITMTPIDGRVDPYFLQRYFQTPIGRALLLRVSPGSAGRNRTMSIEGFLREPVPLPPLAEQQRIVARLDALAAKLDEATRLRASADSANQALIASVVRQKVRAFPSQCWLPIADIATLRGGGTPSKIDPSYWEGPIPWISPKDMKRRTLSDAEDHISLRATEETSARVLPVGAVLIVIRGMILAHTVPTGVLAVPGTINQDMKAIVPRPSVDSRFLCEVLWALNSDLLGLVDRSTHDTRKLLTEKLLHFKVPVPDLHVQREFVRWSTATVDSAADAADNATAMSRHLAALLPSCVSRAFAGAL